MVKRLSRCERMRPERPLVRFDRKMNTIWIKDIYTIQNPDVMSQESCLRRTECSGTPGSPRQRSVCVVCFTREPRLVAGVYDACMIVCSCLNKFYHMKAIQSNVIVTLKARSALEAMQV